MRRASVALRSATRAIVFALVTSLVSPLVAPSTIARAQSSIVSAEALFGQGRDLMAQGKYAEACPKFEDSQKLDPKSSTLLNLANCYEKAGRTATAWATYREAASLAKQEGHEDYVATAVKRADALYPKLSKLVVKVAAPVEGLEIRRDGLLVTPSEWGAAIPTDPGTHVIEASAPKKEAWKGSAVVPGDGGTGTIEVPALKDVKETPPPPPPPPKLPPKVDGTETKSSGAWKTAGWIIGGVGVVGIGVGTFFVLRGKSKFDESVDPANANCRTKTLCDQTGLDLRDQARSAGNLATISFVIGGAALATGVALILFAPSSSESPKPTAKIVPTLGGAALVGAF